MKALVVGSGGREHALVWKLSQEAEVFCTPGNAGIAKMCFTADVQPRDKEKVVTLAQRVEADLVVVGSEEPLIHGLGDSLRAAGIAVVGPSSDAAQLEGSKAFSKRMMVEAKVPTADYGEFNDPDSAKHYVAEMFAKGRNVAVKASGAAFGKGVTVCLTQEEADEAIAQAMIEKAFGTAGETLVIEDCLFGKEFSLLTLVSGTSYRSLPVAQDFKRAFDGDRGPNTGGMGSYSPVPWLSEDLVRTTEERVVEPLLKNLAARGIDFRGVLFSGIMVVGGEPFCLEYNVRFGDPETQTIVRRLGAGFAGALLAVANGEAVPEFEVGEHAAVTVVMASEGYPGEVKIGRSITIPEDLPEEVVVFHAGTATLVDDLVTAGGRVLGVSATGRDLAAARKSAYEAVERIEYKGKSFRTDVGA
jgi:phosphoribosylamine--glycine ligase